MLRNGSPAVKQNTMNKRDLKEYYDLDGLNCSICMEPWTLDGDHQVSCVPCGHVYGLSCINKWIQVKGIHCAKCPQCKSNVGPNDVRKLYASPVVLMQENQLKKDEMSKAANLKKEIDEMSKAADLEIERSNLLLIQDSLLKELRLLKKQVSTGTIHHEGTRKNSYESANGGLVHETQNGVKYRAKVDTCGSRHCNFVLEHEMSVGSACLFDMDASYKVLLLARRDRSGFRHVLEKINLDKATNDGEMMLPTSTIVVKDLHISPCGRLALLASIGKTLSVISMGGGSIVVNYNLPKPAWSCSWDNDNPNYMYAGLEDGMLLVYDLRHTVHPVQSMSGLDSQPIHTIHPFEHNTSHPQNARQLLTASSAGPCVWNINGGMERAFKLPQSASEEARCMSLAYSCASENLIATYGPKTQWKDSMRTPSNFMFGGHTPSSLVLVNRIAGSFYKKSTSISAQLWNAGVTKSTIINVNDCLPMFAYGNDVTNGLKLLEIPSLAVTQNLKTHRHPILDVRYSQSQGSCVLGCISEDILQLYSAKIS